MISVLAMAVALAQDCDRATLEPVPDTLSVAWVSPIGRRARGAVPVVRTSDVRALGTDLGRTLQALGLRRRASPPRRRYKVVVFDVSSEGLCRPVPGNGEGAEGALPACAERFARGTDGCGHVVDRGSDGPGVEVFRARWSTLAREGFCVLPAERFVVGQ